MTILIIRRPHISPLAEILRDPTLAPALVSHERTSEGHLLVTMTDDTHLSHLNGLHGVIRAYPVNA